MKKIKNWCSKKKDIKPPGYDLENFRYKVANDEQESEFFKAIFGSLIQALSDKEFEIDLTSVYDATTIEKNRNKIGEEVYKQVFAFQKEFMMHLKDRVDLTLLVDYLKCYNCYPDCDAIISFYKRSIAVLYFGLLVRIEIIVFRDELERDRDSRLINDHSKYVLDHLEEIIQFYIESLEYTGRFSFNENNYYEKMQLLRINELDKKEGIIDEIFLKIHKKETESLQLQKSLMKDEFPEGLKEKLFDLELKYKKIAQNSRENMKLIEQCHDSLVVLGLIKPNINLFYNFIRNRNGYINWLKQKNEMMFFIHLLSETVNITEIRNKHKWMCDHFTFKGNEIKYNPNLRGYFNRYLKNPPKKNRQELIRKAVKGLENIKWDYKVVLSG